MTRAAKVLVGLLVLLTAGCQNGHFRDPNNPSEAPADEVAETLRRNIVTAAENLNYRVVTRQISDAYRRKMLADYANELLKQGDASQTSPDDAWIYADLLITAGRFSEAIPFLELSVKWATEARNDDRRVNDSLRLARCLVMTGKIKEGLILVQKVIDSKPKDPGPVLPSVLLEIAPVTIGRGNDLLLARLLEESINAHLTMKVDPKSEAGRGFLIAAPFHVRNAWKMNISLLLANKQAELAKRSAERFEAMMPALEAAAAQARMP